MGPYHVARTRAVAARVADEEIQVVAIELCGSEATRDWKTDRDDLNFEIRTVAPDAHLANRLPSQWRRLLPMLNDLKPEAIAVAGYDRPEMRATLRWANQHNAGTILMSETKWDDRARPWWKRMLAARQVRRADAALVSGAASGEYLVSLGMPREVIFRQYGVVDNDFFHRRATRLGQIPDVPPMASPPCFVAACRLIERRKNIRCLIDAYERYRQRVGDDAWRLVICGDGPDRNCYERIVRERQSQGVAFAGFQQAKELASYYAAASCFVHTAMNEAWGLVVNEAMAAGLPVLVSRRCGCAYDLVHEGVNGYLFNPHDPDELAEQMLLMSRLRSGKLADFGAASRRIISRWGTDRFAEGIVQAMQAIHRRRK